MHLHQSTPEDSGEPVLFPDETPGSLKLFANELVAARALEIGLEIGHIPVDKSGARRHLEEGIERFAHLPGASEWVVWSAFWVNKFGEFSGAAAVRLRMSHSRFPTCPLFHVDAIPMRLIATLAGPGTEWLRSENVVRLADGRISQTPEPDVVQQLAPGSVGIFRGEALERIPGRGVVHRSPPDRVDRVVVTLDIAA